jgi:NADH:ubiquinone oxidoreductase subunit E
MTTKSPSKAPGLFVAMPAGAKVLSDVIAALQQQLAEVTRERDALVAALKEIQEGRGPFSRDHLQHATNTIESMKEIAATALAAVEAKEGK